MFPIHNPTSPRPCARDKTPTMRLLRRSTLVAAAALASRGAPAQPSHGPSIREVFAPVAAHVHASSVVESADGALLVCWYQGSGERQANDVAIRGARRAPGARRFGPSFPMADTPGFPDCNPTLFVDRRGRLWLFWVVVKANRWEHAELTFRRADHWEGPGAPRWSWQGGIHLAPGERFATALERGLRGKDPRADLWAEYAPPYTRLLVEAARDPAKRQTGWMTRNHPIALPGGRIVLPLYSDGFNVSLVAISDDDGETWRAGGPIVGLGPVQPSIVRRRDGSLVAYLRDNGGAPFRVQRSVSADGGETWTAATDTTLPNPGSSLEVLALRDGRWVMAGNAAERGRHDLTLRISSDEGRSWSRGRALREDHERRRTFAYPSLWEGRKGRLHVTWSEAKERGETIVHAELDPDWIGAMR